MNCKIEDVVVRPRVSIYSKYIKRLMDIILCSVAIIVLSPVFIAISLLELKFHDRPVLYKTKRPGLNGKLFDMLKFRSMTNEVGQDGLPLPDDKRLTKFGRFLRKYSLDELPELFNIVKGDMSIIGPRPLLEKYLDLYSPRYRMRHAVKPGLACPKVFKKGEERVLTGTWREQFEADIYYVEHLSFLYDLKVFAAIVQELFAHDDYRTNATRAEFNGNNLDE